MVSDEETPLAPNANAGDTALNNNNDNNNNNNDHPNYHFMSRLMHWMSLLGVGYDPLFLPSVFTDNADEVVTLSFLLALANMAIEYYWFTLGGSKVAIRVLSTSLAIAYGSVFCITREGVLDPEFRDLLLGNWLQPVSNTVLTVCLGLALAGGHSFVDDHLADTVTEEQMSHPITKHYSKTMASIWMTAFSVMSATGLIGMAGTLFMSDLSEDFVEFFLNPGYLANLALIFGFVGQLLYRNYLTATIDQKLEFYKDDIDRWNRDHPNVDAPFGIHKA